MIFKHLSDKYWSYYDELKSLESICPSEDGRAIYRKGQLVWKTKALIVEDGMIFLRNALPTTGDIPPWTDEEKERLKEVLTKILGVKKND